MDGQLSQPESRKLVNWLRENHKQLVIPSTLQFWRQRPSEVAEWIVERDKALKKVLTTEELAKQAGRRVD